MSRSAVNRWIRDRIEVDSRYPQSAKQYIRQLEKAIEGIHPGHRSAAIAHAREYAVLYYGDRHKHTPVPRTVTARLDRIEQRAEKAERFDRAREFVAKYGPPEKALATFMKAPVLEKARVEVQQTKQIEPTKEKLRGHDIPWMMTTGPIHEMSQKHLDQAQRNYDQWPHKDKRSFVEYVNFTREHWNKSPEDRQPAKQQERPPEKQPAAFPERTAGGIPWQMHSGPIRAMTREQMDAAKQSYASWEGKGAYKFPKYVQYMQRRWANGPEYIKVETEKEKSRQVELSR